MRHRVRGRKLSRTASHRAALMSSLATSLLRYKRIKTTLAKAKETRGFVESLITKARKGDLHSRRQIMKVIHDKEVIKELYADIVEKIGDRPGGYTRVVKLGTRNGDAAQMAIIELVDFNDVVNKAAEEKKEVKEEKTEKAKEVEDKKESKPKEKKAKKIEAAKKDDVEDANVVEETSDEAKPKEDAKSESDSK